MNYLQKLKAEKNLTGLIKEEKRINEIVLYYQSRLIYKIIETQKDDKIKYNIEENLIKLDLITVYKEEVSKILGQPYHKVLH